MKRDIALHPDTHDIYIDGIDLGLVADSEALRQNLKVRLLFFTGDWFLDTLAGLPYMESILVKNPNIPSIESVIKAKILETEDVTALTAFDLVLEQRHASISFTVDSPYGQIHITNSLFPGV